MTQCLENTEHPFVGAVLLFHPLWPALGGGFLHLCACCFHHGRQANSPQHIPCLHECSWSAPQANMHPPLTPGVDSWMDLSHPVIAVAGTFLFLLLKKPFIHSCLSGWPLGFCEKETYSKSEALAAFCVQSS